MSRLYWLILVCLVHASFAWGFPDTPILDDFNRANEDPIAGIWSNGVLGAGNCRVLGNELEMGADDKSCYVTAPQAANQEAYITLTGATGQNDNTNVRLFVCLQDGIGTGTVDGYLVRFQKKTTAADKISIRRIDNGVTTILGVDGNLELDDGHKLGVEIFADGKIELWADAGAGWVLQMTRTDTTYTCENTNIGVRLDSLSVDLDDFGGGGQSAASQGPFTILQFR
jgi:hypothetical protein